MDTVTAWRQLEAQERKIAYLTSVLKTIGAGTMYYPDATALARHAIRPESDGWDASALNRAMGNKRP